MVKQVRVLQTLVPATEYPYPRDSDPTPEVPSSKAFFRDHHHSGGQNGQSYARKHLILLCVFLPSHLSSEAYNSAHLEGADPAKTCGGRDLERMALGLWVEASSSGSMGLDVEL